MPERISTSCPARPIRSPTWAAMAAPTTEWSASRPLPMSCSSAPSSSRSGRETVVASLPACTVVWTRCRSTVHTCTASRGGRSRTAPHSGNSRPHSPVRSNASTTSTSPEPVVSSENSASRADFGHGLRSSGARSASLDMAAACDRRVRPRGRGGKAQQQGRIARRVDVAGERNLGAVQHDALVQRAPHRLPAQAGHHGPARRRRRAPCESPRQRRRRRIGPPRRACRPTRSGRQGRARRPPRRRPAHAGCPATGRPRDAARCARRAEVPLPRTVPRPGRSTNWATARESSSCRSRRPPRPCLRSGSTRCATSPLRVQRWSPSRPARPACSARSTRHACLAEDTRRCATSTSPAISRASKRPSAARRSLPATLSDSAHGAHRMVEADAGIPQRIPELLGKSRDLVPAVVHEHEIEIGVGHELAGGRAHRPRAARPRCWRCRRGRHGRPARSRADRQEPPAGRRRRDGADPRADLISRSRAQSRSSALEPGMLIRATPRRSG